MRTLAAASIAAAVSSSANWTVLPSTRCHNDIVQFTAVASLSACEDACFSPPHAAQLVTYCAGSAAACENLAGHCWCYPLVERADCGSASAAWSSAWTADAPPPPPPPAPVPADWAPLVAAGDMLFWGGGPFAEPGFWPALGNGNLAMTTSPVQTLTDTGNNFGAFYLAGVFNGVGNSTPSHRAAIPNAADVRLAAAAGGTYRALGAALNLRRGSWQNRTLVDAPGCRGAVLEQRAYAHRAERSLFLVELRAAAPEGSAWPAGGCVVALQWAVDAASPDFSGALAPPRAPGAPALLSLTSMAAETAGAPLRRVTLALPPWLAAAGGALNATFALEGDALLAVLALRSDLDASDPDAAAASDWARAEAAGSDALLASHDEAMALLWASGIEIEGNFTIAAAVNSSLYYIISALRNDVNFSTCPGGLAVNSYHGHTFWDMETWQYPPLLLLHPDLAAGALQYRLDRLDRAVARSGSFGFTGANWPWESAYSGVDTVTAGNIEGWYEHHISADIPLAMRQYYLATQDAAWLARAWPALNASCQFWACRFSRVDAAPVAQGCGGKDGAGNFTIKRAQGPDENAGVVDDQLYTVGAGAATLAFCGAAAAALGLPALPPLWAEMARSPYLPVNDSLYSEGPVHPEYAGYSGAHINQADVALLQYPLGIQFDADLARRDLDYYSGRTGLAQQQQRQRQRQPGVSICPFFTGNSAYGIAYLALGNRTAADAQFELGFLHQAPGFNVWTEYTPEAGFGHWNFITGAGGWLQAVLFGYPGARLPPGGGVLRFATPVPTLPPGGVTRVRLRGLHLLGAAFDFAYDAAQICVRSSGGGAVALQLRVEATGETLAIAGAEACVPLQAVAVERLGSSGTTDAAADRR